MLEQIERLLKQRIGLDAESVGRSVIERAVRQRMKAIGQHEAETYWLTLCSSPGEQQALVETVVVPETWFFRYPDAFRALARLALERHAQLQGARTLRLISLPCSSGEEPYSMAMTLLDAGFAPSQFQIDALDVSEKVLEHARRGLYGRNSFRGNTLEFRERYFREQAGEFLLDERVRSCVRLRAGNLLDSNLLTTEPPYDFIFCRNLLIYFDRATQLRALQQLKRQLQPEGLLFVGPAEASLASQNGLQALGHQQTFAFRLSPATAAEQPPPRVPDCRPRTRATPVPRLAATAKPRAKSLEAKPTPAPAKSSDLWQEVANLANAGRSAEARLLCERQLQQQGPCATAYYWLGLLSDADGNDEQASAYYRKAIYLQPRHREALAHLATHLEAQGDMAGAKRLYQRAQTDGVADND
ncbi:CheR family methyltransferase [Pseudomonas sp. NCCP-436]|uniref:CheR family methyltransferase n=1 Tax=Pseudomonas sp. NCCP-436 TaxID=2842481 RepID=UPI001C804637|nr:CheR family methyltransferase [Pseudomonas sp. NCCP-436]GIZ12898.1 putative biofilm formation methyltransferase WspC [Pseudomonas sp. NCCP-436]